MSTLTRPLCQFCVEGLQDEIDWHDNHYEPAPADVMYQNTFACAWHALFCWGSRPGRASSLSALEVKSAEVFL